MAVGKIPLTGIAMKTLLATAATVAMLLAAPSQAQLRSAVVGGEVEALVTVVSVDKEKRVVVLRGPRGNEVELQVPPEAQNLDRVKKGSVFRVKYAEALAIAITRGGAPSKGDDQTLQVAKKGANPGGTATRTRHVSGRIEAIDLKNRYVAVRGPERTVSMQVGDDVKLEELQVGDRISIAYTQGLALEMVPQEKKAKPEAKKKLSG
jgi:Cu/Ag efflux protein CusF